jgi:chemotaxis protein MotC
MKLAVRFGIVLCLIGITIPTIDAVSRSTAAAQPVHAGNTKDRPSFGTERQPHHAVRALATLQERIAHGDTAAVSSQRALVADIAAEFRAFPLEVWRNIRNRQALIKYALSGGDPETLHKVLAQKLFEEPELPLAQAALAYAEGQRAAAMRLLGTIDVAELPPTLAGHVALVKAIIIANNDLDQVIRHTDDARLLSPGTLVEETALRLAIEAAITQRNRSKFEATAQRYLRRFPRSPYLTTIIPPVAIAMTEGDYMERADGAKWAHGAVQFLAPNRLVQFYAIVAEAGLRRSKLATTGHAARMIRKYAREGSPELAIALAYEGAATVVGPESVSGLALLDAAEAAGVPAPIGALITKARAMAKLIQAPPAPVLESVSVLETDGRLSRPVVPASLDVKTLPEQSPSPSATRIAARISQIDKFLEELDR